MRTLIKSALSLILLIFIAHTAGAQVPLSEIAHPTEDRLTFTDIAKIFVVLSGVLSILLIVYLSLKGRYADIDPTGKWLHFLAIFMFPVFIMFGGNYFALEEFKSVDSCMSCHEMHPFGSDMMLNTESNTLVAKHFQNRWVNKNECYTCHTGYGASGTLQGKVDGLRHLYGKATGWYPKPIRYRGQYPNDNCLSCHIGGRSYESVQIHRALHENIVDERISCMRCHSNVHPPMQERFYPVVTFEKGEIK